MREESTKMHVEKADEFYCHNSIVRLVDSTLDILGSGASLKLNESTLVMYEYATAKFQKTRVKMEENCQVTVNESVVRVVEAEKFVCRNSNITMWMGEFKFNGTGKSPSLTVGDATMNIMDDFIIKWSDFSLSNSLIDLARDTKIAITNSNVQIHKGCKIILKDKESGIWVTNVTNFICDGSKVEVANPEDIMSGAMPKGSVMNVAAENITIGPNCSILVKNKGHFNVSGNEVFQCANSIIMTNKVKFHMAAPGAKLIVAKSALKLNFDGNMINVTQVTVSKSTLKITMGSLFEMAHQSEAVIKDTKLELWKCQLKFESDGTFILDRANPSSCKMSNLLSAGGSLEITGEKSQLKLEGIRGAIELKENSKILASNSVLSLYGYHVKMHLDPNCQANLEDTTVKIGPKSELILRSYKTGHSTLNVKGGMLNIKAQLDMESGSVLVMTDSHFIIQKYAGISKLRDNTKLWLVNANLTVEKGTELNLEKKLDEKEHQYNGCKIKLEGPYDFRITKNPDTGKIQFYGNSKISIILDPNSPSPKKDECLKEYELLDYED